jgi:hypothetical protein
MTCDECTDAQNDGKCACSCHWGGSEDAIEIFWDAMHEGDEGD